jgi:hypothetical protein
MDYSGAVCEMLQPVGMWFAARTYCAATHGSFSTKIDTFFIGLGRNIVEP